MKGKRRGRDFIIISFSTSQYIFVFTKTLSCYVILTIMWSLKNRTNSWNFAARAFCFLDDGIET